MNGNNNTASLVCTDLDPKLAEKLRAILVETRRNEVAVKEMSEKLDQIKTQMDKETIPPDVAMRLVYPQSPSLVLINRSGGVARDIKWSVVLWNMDLPGRQSPLPIPVSPFDWLKPSDESGPLNLFDGPLVAELLKPGNRLFGSATVNCPQCDRGRTYIVFIVWGQGGWFSEVDTEPGKLIIPLEYSEAGRNSYFRSLESQARIQLRKPIRGLWEK
jgi:hypothetical protein